MCQFNFYLVVVISTFVFYFTCENKTTTQKVFLTTTTFLAWTYWRMFVDVPTGFFPLLFFIHFYGHVIVLMPITFSSQLPPLFFLLSLLFHSIFLIKISLRLWTSFVCVSRRAFVVVVVAARQRETRNINLKDYVGKKYGRKMPVIV